MNWLLWLFIAVLVGMLVYPIVSVVPTRRDKDRVALRQAAMARGIKLDIRQPKLPEKLQSPYARVEKTVGYGLALHHCMLTQSHTALRNPNTGEWFWLNGCRPPADIMQALLDIYEQLPDYCLAVEQNRNGSIIFLLESFSIEQLDIIYKSLTKLNQVIHK